MSSDYGIGLSEETMLPLDGLEYPLDDPLADPMQYAQVLELGDGSKRGVGWLTQTWHWGFLSIEQRNMLESFVGPVYVRTIGNDDTFGTYTATLVWPEEEPEHRVGLALGLDIELRKLVEFEPEESW